MEEKNVNNNNRTVKPLIALALVALVGIIGGTFAYFNSTSVITTTLSTKPYSTTVTDTFTSPENWLPGTTTPKTVSVTNSGEVPIAVRASYTESWEDSTGNPLSPTISVAVDDGNGGTTNETQRAVVLNFTQNSNWTSRNENSTTYYYYNYFLDEDDTTEDSFIQSILFNTNVVNSCNPAKIPQSTVTNQQTGVTTITSECESTGTGYDNATYTLTITVETVQFDQYQTYWGTQASITAKPVSGS